jgi:hypothetical protein
MKISRYKEEKNFKIKKKALALHKEGLTLREIGPVVGKSYEWVRTSIKELTSLDKK